MKNVSRFALLVFLLSSACNFPYVGMRVPTSVRVATSAPTIPQQAVAVSAPTLVPTVIVTIAANAEPSGCQRPPDDYTRVVINGARLNIRTVWMLKRARELAGGTIDFAGQAITQGSYNPGGVTASFGTHDGGGAVDISVLDPKTGKVLRSELPNAIHALRVAGFAAWVREPNDLYPGSPIHIHAVAIGDAELSPAAREQLTGQYAYFKGYDGLPRTDNMPVQDRHGGPILCNWMREMGYRVETAGN